ncbi:Copper resistance protein A precursor [Pseudoruegeria aquimaris]|uniref:Copper resistance protein A n=1 Tax=Pseudoruegeria aquimaris TaxID=393663 RepID=A0A1Y5T7Z7_9RHOB|nr:multicopper oxidase family protein [Pseudoruegeria aquimaris]SLN54520.1 Copper resistance protein A precursor [Pseudoruegeria aquimaris]
MKLVRRQFMAGAAALTVWPKTGGAATAPRIIEARAGTARVVPGDYPETEIWGYDGGVPGPLIRARQGETVSRKLVNALPQPTAIHWHGLRVPNGMDGVPGLTQEAVPTGGAFLYELPLKDAGTYWYHSHNQSTEQVARGLYGVVVVDEAEPPEVDHDITVLLDDWRLSQQAQITEDFGAMHDWTHAGRMGNYVHARLLPSPPGLLRHQRLRLRLLNVATDRIMAVSLNGLEGRLVARDGMPVEQPQPFDMLVFGPAERADLIVDVTAGPGEAAQILLHQRDGAFVLAELPVTGQGASVPRGEIQALPPNPVPAIGDFAQARAVPLRMEGGAMGGLRQGTYLGRLLSARELVEEGQIWTFNGVAGLPEEPLASLSRGEVLRIPMRNDTAFPHAMHLHGTHFREVLPGGGLGPLRDTILVNADETREIAFVADNPGDWLLHCHMLSHQAAGMKTWIRVT